MGITEIFFRRKITSKLHGPFETGRGTPLPLGPTVTPQGINFAIFSEQAKAMKLVLKRQKEEEAFIEINLDPKYNKTGHIWHITVFELSPKIEYGFKATGPDWHDSEIILLDPYCKSISGKKKWGKKSPLKSFSRIPIQQFDWQGDSPLLIPIQDTIIYETHVRGFTRHPSSKTKHPGTYHALIEKIPYLKELGITAVELMPICEFDENDNIHNNPVTGVPLKNYWGYNTIGFFCPKASYAAKNTRDNHIQEFKTLVRELHKANIEVILDVVFNHTAEGNEKGPTIHFRGLDNPTYYILGPNGEYHNYSGCGNTVNCNHPLIRNYIIDCLHYWVTELHVDGFRFDLASILGRAENGAVLENPPLIERIARDPVLANTKLIAEAWDAAGLYQVGSFPSCGRWAEWNGKYRDDVRQFVKGNNGFSYAMNMRFLGSPDLYDTHGRYPYHSINFITSHDGFTLHDLVSYNDKHNDMNGEGNRDGCNDNHSWNCGLEGETDHPQVLHLRQQQMKNFVTILFLSQGVPMLLAGDEFCRTQQGNNNAYCQDNSISWIDWTLKKKNKDFFRFTREIIAFRKRHPILRRKEFLKEMNLKCKDIEWHGTKIGQPDWSYYSHTLAFCLKGSHVNDQDIYVAMNSYWEALEFEIPSPGFASNWHLLADTSKNSPEDIVPENKNIRKLKKLKYLVQARSMIVLISTQK